MNNRISAFLAAFVIASVPAISLPARAKDDPSPIAAAFQPFIDSHAVAGAVTLVANKDGVLDVQAVGFSDVGAKTGMKPDAIFWIASQSKPITATCLMMLVDEGKVSLDDPVEKFIPQFKDVSG